MKQSTDHLLEEIARLTQEVDAAKAAARLAKHNYAHAQTVLAKLQGQSQTMQTLNLGIFSMLEVDEIYSLACESVVYQLNWDAAFVISLQPKKLKIIASYQATKKQLDYLEEFGPTNRQFVDSYARKNAISTYHSDDVTALSLRTLFHTDEVVAMPILFSGELYGYLVVCAHTDRGGKRNSQEIEFLASVAGQIGHAVQNSQSFQDLEQQNRKLRELDELKNSFISITSHQLRTPLSIIKWILSILDSDAAVKKLTKQHTLVQQAYESNERLIHVVNDLLNVSRIENGRLPYNPQLIDLGVVLTDLANAAKKLCSSHKIKLTYKAPAKLPLVEVDPLLFKEAVQNLIDNAIDYNREKGLIAIEVTLHPHGLEIAVTNTGIGITADEQKKIFNQFYRSPESVKLHPNGNGLGLFLSSAIIKEHGGQIACHSVPDAETTFTVSLPLSKP